MYMLQFYSVHERLPEDGEMVLAFHRCIDPEDNMVIWKSVPWVFQAKFYRNSGWKVFFCPDPRPPSGVTHWATLPNLKEIEERDLSKEGKNVRSD